MASNHAETAVAFSVVAITAESIALAEKEGGMTAQDANELRKNLLDQVIKSDEEKTDPMIRKVAAALVVQETLRKIGGMN